LKMVGLRKRYITGEFSRTVTCSEESHISLEMFGNKINNTFRAFKLSSDVFSALRVLTSGNQVGRLPVRGLDQSQDCIASLSRERERAGPRDAVFDFGEISILGPRSLQQDRTCVSGQTCNVEGVLGNLFSANEWFAVLHTCGVGLQVLVLDDVDGLVFGRHRSVNPFAPLQKTEPLNQVHLGFVKCVWALHLVARISCSQCTGQRSGPKPRLYS